MFKNSSLDTYPVTTIKYSNDKTGRRCFIVLPHVHVDTTVENDSSPLSKAVATAGGSVTLDVQCMWLNELDGLYEYMEDITHDLEDAPSWRVILMDDDDLETASSRKLRSASSWLMCGRFELLMVTLSRCPLVKKGHSGYLMVTDLQSRILGAILLLVTTSSG